MFPLITASLIHLMEWCPVSHASACSVAASFVLSSALCCLQWVRSERRGSRTGAVRTASLICAATGMLCHIGHIGARCFGWRGCSVYVCLWVSEVSVGSGTLSLSDWNKPLIGVITWSRHHITARRARSLTKRVVRLLVRGAPCLGSPLVALSDIWQGDFLACGQAERGERSVRRQAAKAKPLINTLDRCHLTDTLMYSQAD